MYIAASGVSASMARQNVLSNNLANVTTVGFRPDSLDLRTRDAARIEDNLGSLPSNLLLERLGAGVMPMATRVSTSQGLLASSENPLDTAINGDGFFVTRSSRATSVGPESMRLTRDGRMTVRGDGALVNIANGSPYLDDQGVAIHVDPSSPAPVQIAPDGSVRQGGAQIARLRIATVADPGRLIKDGDNQLKPQDGPNSLLPAPGRVEQGKLEQSGVDAVQAMMQITDASQAAQGGLAMISMYGEMMSRAISSLGRVA